MGRIDTTSFANSLMGGLQTGIQLGQNADAQRFARERAGAQDRQTQFGNMLALDAQAMRRQEIAAIAAERSAARIEKENARTAARQLMSVASSGKPFDPNDPAFFPLLYLVDEKTQQYFYKAAADNKFIQKKRSQYDSYVAAGIRFTKEEADDFARFDIDVDGKHILKSDRQIEEETDAADKESIIVTLNENGWLPGGDIEKAKRNSTKHLANILKMRMDEVAVQQAAIAEQQAAAQKQKHTTHVGQLIQKKRAGVTLSPQEEGVLATTPGLSEYETKQPESMSPFAFADDQTKLLDTEIGRIEQELLNQGVATKENGAFLLGKGKVKEGDGSGWFADGPTPEYSRRQELLKQRDQLIKQREALGMAQIQKSIKPIAEMLWAKLGRKPTAAEVRAELGAPPSSQSLQGQGMQSPTQ